MHFIRPKKGQVINYERPVWEPLIELATRHVDDFMWMHEVELEDGTRLHAYKHWETRRYLHLDYGGRAFVFVWDENRDSTSRGNTKRSTRNGCWSSYWQSPRSVLASSDRMLPLSSNLGEDPRRVSLEVIAVETAVGHLMVIHAMKLRPRYQAVYKEVRR